MSNDELSPSILKYDNVLTQTSAETCRRAQIELLSRGPQDLVLPATSPSAVSSGSNGSAETSEQY